MRQFFQSQGPPESAAATGSATATIASHRPVPLAPAGESGNNIASLATALGAVAEVYEGNTGSIAPKAVDEAGISLVSHDISYLDLNQAEKANLGYSTPPAPTTGGASVHASSTTGGVNGGEPYTHSAPGAEQGLLYSRASAVLRETGELQRRAIASECVQQHGHGPLVQHHVAPPPYGAHHVHQGVEAMPSASCISSGNYQDYTGWKYQLFENPQNADWSGRNNDGCNSKRVAFTSDAWGNEFLLPSIAYETSQDWCTLLQFDAAHDTQNVIKTYKPLYYRAFDAALNKKVTKSSIGYKSYLNVPGWTRRAVRAEGIFIRNAPSFVNDATIGLFISAVYKFANARFQGRRFEVVVRGQHLKYHHNKFTDQGILFPIEDAVPRFELVVGKLRDAGGCGTKKSHREAFLNVWYQNE